MLNRISAIFGVISIVLVAESSEAANNWHFGRTCLSVLGKLPFPPAVSFEDLSSKPAIRIRTDRNTHRDITDSWSFLNQIEVAKDTSQSTCFDWKVDRAKRKLNWQNGIPPKNNALQLAPYFDNGKINPLNDGFLTDQTRAQRWYYIEQILGRDSANNTIRQESLFLQATGLTLTEFKTFVQKLDDPQEVRKILKELNFANLDALSTKETNPFGLIQLYFNRQCSFELVEKALRTIGHAMDSDLSFFKRMVTQDK